MNISEAFNKTMDFEGGGRLHNTTGDPGGLTRWGFSQRAYPYLNLQLLDYDMAEKLFQDDYWDKVRADDLPPELRWDVVDFAFNAGARRAARTLQKSINLCLRSQSRHDYLAEDGRIGPKTLFHVDDVHPDRLLRVFRAYRVGRYLGQAEYGMSQFIHGWLRRAEGIHG